jgi:hypothetical protein
MVDQLNNLEALSLCLQGLKTKGSVENSPATRSTPTCITPEQSKTVGEQSTRSATPLTQTSDLGALTPTSPVMEAPCSAQSMTVSAR